jgi:hypothetical protein
MLLGCAPEEDPGGIAAPIDDDRGRPGPPIDLPASGAFPLGVASGDVDSVSGRIVLWARHTAELALRVAVWVRGGAMVVEANVAKGEGGFVHAEVGELSPGVWHEYENCRDLDLYNCCFSTELLRNELAWTREDPLLGYLLWTGPYAQERRGILSVRLDEETLAESVGHLDALDRLRARPISLHRGDIIGRLALFLSCVGRALFGEGDLVRWFRLMLQYARQIRKGLPDGEKVLAAALTELLRRVDRDEVDARRQMEMGEEEAGAADGDITTPPAADEPPPEDPDDFGAGLA